MQRRNWLRRCGAGAGVAWLGPIALAGCAETPAVVEGATAAAVAEPGRPLHWRTLQGGFMVPALPGVGLPSPAATGLYVRWHAPGALALRGNELLVADFGNARLWRVDLLGQGITGIVQAPVGPGMALALGPDLSAWVLDPQARQVLRFARDGRLLQTQRIDNAVATPVDLGLADGGATVLVADGIGAAWSEQRGTSPFARIVAPQGPAGARVSSVDAIVPTRGGYGDGIFVLDRLAGVVHRISRTGNVLETLGKGELAQPIGIALDRWERVYVHDAQDGTVKRLRRGATAQRYTAADLGVTRISRIAADGALLAVADSLVGQVAIHSFAHDAGA